MSSLHHNDDETAGNGWKRSDARIERALALAGKREALAHRLGMSAGQLSKTLNGSLGATLRLLDELGLEVYERKHVSALESILREKL